MPMAVSETNLLLFSYFPKPLSVPLSIAWISALVTGPVTWCPSWTLLRPPPPAGPESSSHFRFQAVLASVPEGTANQPGPQTSEAFSLLTCLLHPTDFMAFQRQISEGRAGCSHPDCGRNLSWLPSGLLSSPFPYISLTYTLVLRSQAPGLLSCLQFREQGSGKGALCSDKVSRLLMCVLS